MVKRNFKETHDLEPIENMLLKAKEKNIYKKFLSNTEPSSDIAKVEHVFEEITIVWRNPLYGVRKHDFKLKHSFIFSDSLIPGLSFFYFHIKYRIYKVNF